MELIQALKSTVAILAIVNPLGAAPIFLNLMGPRPAAETQRTARVAALTVAVALIVSAWAGEAIFELFSIRLASFRVGGGILVMIVAISMLNAKTPASRTSKEEEAEARERENVAVVPLGIPLMAGPGAISLIIVQSQNLPTIQDKLLLNAEIAVVAVLAWLALRSAEPVMRSLGATGVNVLVRLMGLILAAVAVEMIAAGAIELFPGLA